MRTLPKRIEGHLTAPIALSVSQGGDLNLSLSSLVTILSVKVFEANSHASLNCQSLGHTTYIVSKMKNGKLVLYVGYIRSKLKGKMLVYIYLIIFYGHQGCHSIVQVPLS